MRLLLLLVLICISFNTFGNRLDKMFEGETSIEKPFDLRDPFRPPKFKSQKRESRKKEFNGVFERNLKQLEGQVDINKINIVGVLIGKKRRVMIEVGADIFTLSEGEKVGVNGPEIKAILPAGIILVEQIVNIYDEPEYIETVIPISQ